MLKMVEMTDDIDSMEVHPPGDLKWLGVGAAGEAHLDTYGGRVHVEWDLSAKVTAFGPLSYFIHFLKNSGLWDEWVELCPLRFTSNNAPSKQKILGTALLSILAGHKRYAHITSVRSDKVLPELLGIDGIASEDSVRRAFLHASNEDLTLWLDRCMNTVFEPLLSEPWVLDVDATVKTLYGKQEEARVGYNRAPEWRSSSVAAPLRFQAKEGRPFLCDPFRATAPAGVDPIAGHRRAAPRLHLPAPRYCRGKAAMHVHDDHFGNGDRQRRSRHGLPRVPDIQLFSA
jgi:hypothetical protein